MENATNTTTNTTTQTNVTEGEKVMELNKELLAKLCQKHLLVSGKKSSNYAHYNAILLAEYGIKVDKPSLLNKEMVETIDRQYHLWIPESFYANPQDTKYFSTDELLIEQIVSYFLAYGDDNCHVEIFKKDLPGYVKGDELVLREFSIITPEQAIEVLKEMAQDMCTFTRPWSAEDAYVAKSLFDVNLISTSNKICCKENIILLLNSDVNFATQLDKKDMVKMSVSNFGECSDLKKHLTERQDFYKDRVELFTKAMPLVKDCPLTKKQVKYYNKLVSLFGGTKGVHNSPNIKAIKCFKNGDIIGAANIFAANGSMLDRNLKMLLSRTNSKNEAMEIIDKIEVKNPIVLYQLLSNLASDDGSPRTFNFIKNCLQKSHQETEYETTWRKSKLSDDMKVLLKQAATVKMYNYYKNLPSLGKIYINNTFKKIAMPTNTSANGSGIDILPTGSRLPVKYDNIRAFVHWKNVHDIDLSASIIDNNDNVKIIDWRTYANKEEGNDALYSGDCTSRSGAEFFDLKLNNLKNKGARYIILELRGYGGMLNEGEIFCGYQNKENLDTTAWDAKNIETQFRVYGNSRECLAFAIDLTTSEIVTLNIMADNLYRVVDDSIINKVKRYLNEEYLNINMATMLACRGNIVSTPEEADVIFDDHYLPNWRNTTQKVVRSFETEKLVSLLK